jgi:DNA-binding MarR family transcriptional regulator
MTKKRNLAVFDEDTGEVFKRKSRKRTEEFYMTKQKDSIALAKMKLTGMEHNVLLFLTGAMGYDSSVQITQKFLARELGTTEATVSTSISSLIDRGLIQRVFINGQQGFTVSGHVAERGKKKESE